MTLPTCPRVATGQQIGVGWTPALSVVKALAALAEARRLGGEAVYWMADEDHDQLEVATTVGFDGNRLVRHRFAFAAPPGTATGWLAWTSEHQRQAEALWGEVPAAEDDTLAGHVRALGAPLWRRGLRPFSPTRAEARPAIQEELARIRALGLERLLYKQAERLLAEGRSLPLDPRTQAAWFCLDPRTGRRRRLEAGETCDRGHWLSPGAALRPLMQSLLIPGLEAVVLGPGERAYWQLTEPCWDKADIRPPRIIARPSVYVLPRGLRLPPYLLEPLREGRWEAFWREGVPRPTEALGLAPDPAWSPQVAERFTRELDRTRARLVRLDRRLAREAAAQTLGMDPEHLRQHLFPLGHPQERVLPGLPWLRREDLLDRMLSALEGRSPLVLLEEP
ncbi:bacillithiol biosynthesis protein BshC [Mesoterricola sediminis]|uniref:Bacillithiol biosynthesis BshC N-terminal Rossmann-like domain-containing protein n=1 Tax=Mesoterricola sediminis TaxID=2927980 RepID=A0AA48H5Y6_9BACT|nr:bacillithiol biosynthesis BshC [Mesoterricola sediminis]BDU76588.1 hypothetical protein METESE_15460 [Mesoterricola sediminis]